MKYLLFAMFVMFPALLLAFMAHLYLQEIANEKERWGPNPGWVSWEDTEGGKGEMMVRDKDNAENEIVDKCREVEDMVWRRFATTQTTKPAFIRPTFKKIEIKE